MAKAKKYSLVIVGSRKYKKSTITAFLGEAKKLFSRVLFVPLNKIQIFCENGATKLYYKHINLTEFDAAYVRISSKDFVLGEIVLDVLRSSHAYVPTSTESYQITNHKYYTVKELSKVSLPILPTSLSVSPEATQAIVKDFGYPVVVKMLSGFAGKGVVLVQNAEQLKSILDTLHMFDEFVSAQKYEKTEAKDIRCYVLGKKVIAVQRTGAKGDWRANISRGGTAEVIQTKKNYEDIALKAAEALGMDICAVDLIETKEGPVVIEVNFMPGPFTKFLGSKIPKEMMQVIYNKVEGKKK